MERAGKGKVKLEKVTLALPSGLLEEIGVIVRSERRWISDLEYIRWALASAVESYRKEHPGPAGPDPGRFTPDDTKGSRR
jgi:hypothetical protein